MNKFKITAKDSNCYARLGLLETPHGTVRTPAFMPVGTSGAVKGITPKQVEEIQPDIILANTYHLMIRPGVDTVEQLGGLHSLMSWNKPILTDSGGFQIFSLSPLTKITDEGVEFSNHVDGSKLYINPEIATKIQNRLGADIIMCFDQCTHFPCEQAQLEKAVERTIKWASICKQSHSNPKQMLFGIVQGGVDLQLRTYCASEITKIDFDGYALGGLSVGEGHENMIRTVAHTAPQLPEDKPRYLMGVGTPADIIAAVQAGIDMFDCVIPTRNGRNAYAFTEKGPIRLRNSSHINDKTPIEAECDCYCCSNFSRGSIRHFFNVNEMLGPILVSIHNLRYFQRFMAKIRLHIENNTFKTWADDNLAKYIDYFSS